MEKRALDLCIENALLMRFSDFACAPLRMTRSRAFQDFG